MTEPIRRNASLADVVEHLGLAPRTLAALREVGLFEEERIDSNAAEELRIAHLLIEELGLNAAGVHVTLHMRRRMLALESRVNRLARVLDERRDGGRPLRRGDPS